MATVEAELLVSVEAHPFVQSIGERARRTNRGCGHGVVPNRTIPQRSMHEEMVEKLIMAKHKNYRLL